MDVDARVDHVTSLFERLLRGSHFLLTDMVLLDRMNQNEDSPTGMLVILTLTFYAKDKLQNRDTYLRWAEKSLRFNLGDKRANDLLKDRR